MALKTPLVLYNGLIGQLAAGDTIPAGSGPVNAGRILRVDNVNGTSGGVRGDWNSPYDTFENAVADALANDLIFLGPGTNTVAARIVFSVAGLTVVGCGKEATLLDFSGIVGGSSLLMELTNNMSFHNMRILSPAAHYIFGSQVNSFSGVVVRSCKLESLGVDVIFFASGSNTYDMKVYDSDLISVFDTFNANAATSDTEFWNCTFLCDGGSSNIVRCICSNTANCNVRAYNCKLTTKNAGGASNNRPFSVTSGKGELHNSVIDSDGSGVPFDILISGVSTLKANNVVRADGKRLVTSGVITWLQDPDPATSSMNLRPTFDYIVEANRGMVFPGTLDLSNGGRLVINSGGCAVFV